MRKKLLFGIGMIVVFILTGANACEKTYDDVMRILGFVGIYQLSGCPSLLLVQP